MLGYIACLMIGGTIGFFTAALLAASGQNERKIEEWNNREKYKLGE